MLKAVFGTTSGLLKLIFVSLPQVFWCRHVGDGDASVPTLSRKVK